MTDVDRMNSSHIVFRNGIVQEWQSNLFCVETDYILTIFIISFCTCNPIENRPAPERRTSSKQILITVRERRTTKTIFLCLSSAQIKFLYGRALVMTRKRSQSVTRDFYCLLWRTREEIWSARSCCSDQLMSRCRHQGFVIPISVRSYADIHLLSFPLIERICVNQRIYLLIKNYRSTVDIGGMPRNWICICPSFLLSTIYSLRVVVVGVVLPFYVHTSTGVWHTESKIGPWP